MLGFVSDSSGLISTIINLGRALLNRYTCVVLTKKTHSQGARVQGVKI